MHKRQRMNFDPKPSWQQVGPSGYQPQAAASRPMLKPNPSASIRLRLPPILQNPLAQFQTAVGTGKQRLPVPEPELTQPRANYVSEYYFSRNQHPRVVGLFAEPWIAIARIRSIRW
jgi:hypothetical protein